MKRRSGVSPKVRLSGHVAVPGSTRMSLARWFSSLTPERRLEIKFDLMEFILSGRRVLMNTELRTRKGVVRR